MIYKKKLTEEQVISVLRYLNAKKLFFYTK